MKTAYIVERQQALASETGREGLRAQPIWSRFLQGMTTFPDGLFDRIVTRKVHLLDMPLYDFGRGET